MNEFDVDEEYKLLRRGVAVLLGAEEPDPPTIAKTCKHESDGFIYEDGIVKVLTGCKFCSTQYYINKNTGEEMQ